MSWPLSQDYNEAIQDPRTSFADSELKTGEAVANALGIPMPRSGNFADVYEIRCPSGSRWAVKCFTRQVHGLAERYSEISKYLHLANLPFMVDFKYLEQGIRVRGSWYPILKMQWVEGFVLNEFVRDNLDKKPVLNALGQIWLRMARRLRESYVAHCDLQHGNVMFVPGSTANSLAVKLIDYDGMCVPALLGSKSGEVGHPAYQHPERLRTGAYDQEVDRFSMLSIATALRCLSVGGRSLWERYDNGDNLLFRHSDLQAPRESPLFQELLSIGDAQAQMLVKELHRACQGPLDKVPLLTDLSPEEKSATKVTKTATAPTAAVTQQVAVAQGPDWNFGAEEEPAASVIKKRPASHGMPVWAWAAIAGTAAMLLLGVGVGVGLFLRKAPAEKDGTLVAQNKPDSKPIKQQPKPPEDGDQQNPASKDNGDRNPPRNDPVVPANPQKKGKRVFQLSPAGDVLALASEADKSWRLVNLRTNKTIHEFREPPSAVTALAFSADGRVAASAHADKVLRLWDVQTGKMTNTVNTYSANVYNIALNPQGSVVACTDGGNRFPVTDLKARNDAMQTGPREVTCLAFSADGKRLALGLDDSDKNPTTVVVVHPQAAGLTGTSCTGRATRVHCLAYSPDGKYLATGHADGKAEVVVWDTTTGREVRRIKVIDAPRIHQVAFSPDSQMVLAASGQCLGSWRISDRKELAVFSPAGTDVVFGAFSADCKQVQLIRVVGENVRMAAHVLPADGVVVKPPEPVGVKPPAPVTGRQRLAVPEPAAVDAAIKDVRDRHKTDPADKLLNALWQETNTAQNNPVHHFALLCLIRDLNADSNVRAALGTVQQMSDAFVIDLLKMRCEVVEKAARSGRVSPADLVPLALPLLDQALGEENDDLTARLTKVVHDQARKLAADPLRSAADARVAFAERLKKAYDKLEVEKKRGPDPIPGKPTAPPSLEWVRFTTGKFHCVERDDWLEGLPLMLQGGDRTSRELARKDLDSPDDARDQKALAEEWANYVRRLPPRTPSALKSAYVRRAYYWYQLAGADKEAAALVKAHPELRPWSHLGVYPPGAKVDPVGGFIRIQPPNTVQTRPCYGGAIDVLATVRGTDLYLLAGNGAHLTIAKDGKGTPILQVFQPDSGSEALGTRVANKPLALADNRWYAVRWRITPKGMTVWIDKQQQYDGAGDYDLSSKRPVAIHCNAAPLEVKLFMVKRAAEN